MQKSRSHLFWCLKNYQSKYTLYKMINIYKLINNLKKTTNMGMATLEIFNCHILTLTYSHFMHLCCFQENHFELSTAKTHPHKHGNICQASCSSQGTVTINRCIHLNLHCCCLLPLERERERKQGRVSCSKVASK